jgi:cell division protein ZapA (FtsZ GTPase activity inhibitor)
MKYAEQIKANAEIGAKIVEDYLKDKREGGEKIEVSVGCIREYHKLLGTNRVKDATTFVICKELAKDKEELREFVAKSLAHLNPLKQLK